MVLLDTGGQVTSIIPIASIQLMGFGQDSEWGKEVNAVLWLGPFWPIECTMALASTIECIIDLCVLHARSVNAHKVKESLLIRREVLSGHLVFSHGCLPCIVICL